MHQSLERGPSLANLGEPSLRTREVREKFLVFVDRLVAFAGARVKLAKIIVGEDSKYGKSVIQDLYVFQRALVPQGRAKPGFGRRIIIGEQVGAGLVFSVTASRNSIAMNTWPSSSPMSYIVQMLE